MPAPSEVDALLTYEGRQALDELVNQGALQDSRVRSLRVRNVGDRELGVDDIAVEWVCTPRPDSPVKEVRLLLSGVTNFDVIWSEQLPFWTVALPEALVQEDGSVHLSFPGRTPEEGGVIEAHRVQAVFVRRQGALAWTDPGLVSAMTSTAGNEPNVLEGPHAVAELRDRLALLDSDIDSYGACETADGGCAVELVCIPRRDSPVDRVRVLFSGVKRFDFQWAENYAFAIVPDYKALIREEGSVYVSLDPYDYTKASPEPEDTCVIEAWRIQAEFVMKP